MTVRRNNSIFSAILIFLFAAISMISCNPDVIKNYPDLPDNPFDDIDYTDGVLEELDIDSSSLLGLHTYIFAPTCAQPGCHDGNFEPDFRTVQSTYNTLVYHPVIKNDPLESFEYRVLPGDRDASWLYERVTTDDAVLGRMPLYDTLTAHEIEQIGKWIDEGAKDIFDQVADQPNFQPSIFGWNVFLNDTNGYRYDTVRADIISPVELPQDSEIEFWFLALDITDEGYGVLGYDLDFNKARISAHPWYFGVAPYIDMTVAPSLAPYNGFPFFSEDTYRVPFYHSFKINTGDFVTGRQYFVRLYLQDDDHPDPTEFPTLGTPPYLLYLMSFVVTP